MTDATMLPTADSDCGAAEVSGKKKRNHWVPQAYLRSFAADPARRKIWTMGIEAGEPRLRPIEKVAVKFYLYAPGSPEARKAATTVSRTSWRSSKTGSAVPTGTPPPPASLI